MLNSHHRPTGRKPSPASLRDDPARGDIRGPGVDNGGDFPNGGDVVGPGFVQLELNVAYQGSTNPLVSLLHRPPGATDGVGVPTLLRWGLVEDLELRFGASLFDIQAGEDGNTVGAGPISLGGKYRFGNTGEESLWLPSSSAIEAQVQLPAGSPAFNGSVVQPSASLNFDYDFPGDFTGSLNVGLAGPVNGTGAQFLQSCVQWSVGYDVSGDLNLFANGLTEYPATTGAGSVTLLGGGWMAYLGDRFAFYGAYNVGVTSDSPNVDSSIGFAVQL